MNQLNLRKYHLFKYSFFTGIIVAIPFLMALSLYLTGKMDIKYLFGELLYCLFLWDVILNLRPAIIEKRSHLQKFI